MRQVLHHSHLSALHTDGRRCSPRALVGFQNTARTCGGIYSVHLEVKRRQKTCVLVSEEGVLFPPGNSAIPQTISEALAPFRFLRPTAPLVGLNLHALSFIIILVRFHPHPRKQRCRGGPAGCCAHDHHVQRRLHGRRRALQTFRRPCQQGFLAGPHQWVSLFERGAWWMKVCVARVPCLCVRYAMFVSVEAENLLDFCGCCAMLIAVRYAKNINTHILRKEQKSISTLKA